MRNAPQKHAAWANRKRPAAAAGFTLLELLVVLVILGLLASVTAPAVARYLSGAKIDAAKLQIQNISTTLDMYRLDTGSYPCRRMDCAHWSSGLRRHSAGTALTCGSPT